MRCNDACVAEWLAWKASDVDIHVGHVVGVAALDVSIHELGAREVPQQHPLAQRVIIANELFSHNWL